MMQENNNWSKLDIYINFFFNEWMNERMNEQGHHSDFKLIVKKGLLFV